MAVAMADVERVSQALNVTVRRVNQLANEGMPREGRGQYDLGKCMLWYIRYLQKALSSKGSMDGDGEISTTKHQRSALLSVQTERETLELAKLRSEVISVADHRAVLSDLVIETKARIVSIAARVAPKVIGESNRVMVQAIISKEIEAALSHLSKTVPRPMSQPKPARKTATPKAVRSVK